MSCRASTTLKVRASSANLLQHSLASGQPPTRKSLQIRLGPSVASDSWTCSTQCFWLSILLDNAQAPQDRHWQTGTVLFTERDMYLSPSVESLPIEALSEEFLFIEFELWIVELLSHISLSDDFNLFSALKNYRKIPSGAPRRETHRTHLPQSCVCKYL